MVCLSSSGFSQCTGDFMAEYWELHCFPHPQNSWHLRSRTAWAWLLSPKCVSIKALLQWSFTVVIACDNQANCSNNAGNDRRVCMDYVSYICAKFYTCINKTSVKCALYPGHWHINKSIIFLSSYYGTHYLPYSIQCSHSKFKLGVFIPPHFEIWGYEVKFEGMTFWDDIKQLLGHAWKDEWSRKQFF